MSRLVGKVFPTKKPEATPVAEAITPVKETAASVTTEAKKAARKKAEK